MNGIGGRQVLWAAMALVALASFAAADEPKQTPENTIKVGPIGPVKPQTFPRPVKFFIEEAIDRSGNPQPMLVYKPRGGIFLDRQPTEIVREALEDTLRATGLLAEDSASADYLLTVYVFSFGLAAGAGNDFYGKTDLNVVVKDARTGASQEVTALGTSIQGLAVRKKNIMKNVKENIEQSLQDGLRNFLRGTKLRDAVAGAAAPAPG